MTSHWGEISTPSDSGITAAEREQLLKLRPMEIEGPRLHQPSSRHCPPTNELVFTPQTYFSNVLCVSKMHLRF